MRKTALKTQMSRIYALLVTGCLVVIYTSRNWVFGKLLSGLWGSYVLPSMLWLMLALGIFYLLPKARPATKLRHRKIFNWAALLCAVAGIGAFYAAGLLTGFGRSPYDHSIRGIIINFFYLGSMLIGMETARAWLVNYLFKKQPAKGVILTALIFTFFAFTPARLLSFETTLDGAMFAGNIFLPSLSENLLASYLAFLGGVVPALIYSGTILAVQWFAPILPDLSWLIKAVVGTFVPAFCMVLLYQLYQSEVLKVKRKNRESENPAGWLAVSAISVMIIWFAVGVFSVFPNVIISGSMSPEIEVGDVILVRRIGPEEVQLGDVLMFREEYARISHRVIEIREDERGLPLFITKGDANAHPDRDPVIAENVIGKVVHVLPKIGWVTILLRSSG
jgi:signal peptidase I